MFKTDKKKLETDYKLKLNPKKTRIDSIKKGIDFLGYMFYLKNNKVILKIRKRTKKKLKTKLRDLKLLKKYNFITKKEFYIMSNSYKGLLKWGNCSNLYYQVFKE